MSERRLRLPKRNHGLERCVLSEREVRDGRHLLHEPAGRVERRMHWMQWQLCQYQLGPEQLRQLWQRLSAERAGV